MEPDISDVLNLHKITIERLLMELGIQIKIGTDFQEYAELCGQIAKKGAVSPAFHPQYSDIGIENGMWMLGFRAKHEIVLTQAIRLLDLKGGNLGAYLDGNLPDIAMGGVRINEEKSKVNITGSATAIAGRVTYHGELWLKGGDDGVRGGSLATLASRHMLITAYLKWKPDYMIGLQAIGTACGGLGIREGYYRIEQGSVMLNIEDYPENVEGWLVWMTAQEAAHNLRVSPKKLFHLLEKSKSHQVASSKKNSRH